MFLISEKLSSKAKTLCTLNLMIFLLTSIIIHTISFHYRIDTEEIDDTPDEEHELNECLLKTNSLPRSTAWFF